MSTIMNYTLTKIEDEDFRNVLIDYSEYKDLSQSGTVLTLRGGQYLVFGYNKLAFKLTPVIESEAPDAR